MILIQNSKFKKTKFGSGKNITFIDVEPNRNEDRNEKVCVCNWKKIVHLIYLAKMSFDNAWL